MLFTIVSGFQFGNQPIQPPLRSRSWAGVEFYSGVFFRDSHLEWRKYQGRFLFARTGQPTVEMKEGVDSVSELRRNYVGTDRAAFDPTGHPFRNRVIFARSSSQFDGTDTFRLRMNPLSRRSVLKNGMRRKSCRIGMVFTGRRGGRH